jgi:hypothetical protein
MHTHTNIHTHTHTHTHTYIHTYGWTGTTNLVEAFSPFQYSECLQVSTRKVLRPATSTQVFLGFPVSIREC